VYYSLLHYISCSIAFLALLYFLFHCIPCFIVFLAPLLRLRPISINILGLVPSLNKGSSPLYYLSPSQSESELESISSLLGLAIDFVLAVWTILTRTIALLFVDNLNKLEKDRPRVSWWSQAFTQWFPEPHCIYFPFSLYSWRYSREIVGALLVRGQPLSGSWASQYA
jgi:hypothetical protein